MLSVHTIINKPIPSNCYVLYDKSCGNDCIIIDPGSRSNLILFAFLEEANLRPIYIILTHEHFDHCWGVNDIISKFHLPIICSKLCAEAIKSEKSNCSFFYDNQHSFSINSESISVESLDYTLPIFDTNLYFWISPGHTDASICMTINHFLFSGDTLIQFERTVTKLPTGSIDKLKDTIVNLSKLQGSGFTVYPGHGFMFMLDTYDLGLMLKE